MRTTTPARSLTSGRFTRRSGTAGRRRTTPCVATACPSTCTTSCRATSSPATSTCWRRFLWVRGFANRLALLSPVNPVRCFSKPACLLGRYKLTLRGLTVSFMKYPGLTGLIKCKLLLGFSCVVKRNNSPFKSKYQNMDHLKSN